MSNKLRAWTKENLTEADYEFAVSDGSGKWNCLASTLWESKSPFCSDRAMGMFIWEIWREIHDGPPYLSVPEHLESIQEEQDAPPFDLPPLTEIPIEKVTECKARLERFANDPSCDERLVYQGMSIHAFLIRRTGLKTEDIVQQFRKWLVEFLTQPDPRDLMNRVKKHDIRFRPGRKDAATWLRALAVRRLKECGYSREETETRLRLKRYTLSKVTNYQWSKLPKIAMRHIQELIAMPFAFGSWAPFEAPPDDWAGVLNEKDLP